MALRPVIWLAYYWLLHGAILWLTVLSLLVQVKPEILSWSPRIILLHNFLSSEVDTFMSLPFLSCQNVI